MWLATLSLLLGYGRHGWSAEQGAQPSSASGVVVEDAPRVAVLPMLQPLLLQIGARIYRALDIDARASLGDWEPSGDDTLLVQRDRDGTLPVVYVHMLGRVPHQADRYMVRVYRRDGVSVFERLVAGPPPPVMRIDPLPATLRDERYAYDFTVWVNGAATRTVRRYIRIETPSQVDSSLVVEVLRGALFDRNEAPTAELIERVKALRLPPTGPVTIEAHTADEGSKTACAIMSQRRAGAVRALLASNGIAESRMQALGKGDAEPLVPNFSAKGREENRRVVIKWPPLASARPAKTAEDEWPARLMQLVIDRHVAKWKGEDARFIAKEALPEVSLELPDGRALLVSTRETRAEEDLARDNQQEDQDEEQKQNDHAAKHPFAHTNPVAQAPPDAASKTVFEGEVRGDLFKGAGIGLDMKLALDRVLALLQSGRRLELEVHSHSSPSSSADSDLTRTQREAYLLIDYLSQKGISQDRVKAIAKGRSQPLVPPVGRKSQEVNRRVVMRVIE